MYKINYGKSIFYNIFESNNFNSVFKDYIENKKNYISRHKMVDDKIIYENYDFEKKIFSD